MRGATSLSLFLALAAGAYADQSRDAKISPPRVLKIPSIFYRRPQPPAAKPAPRWIPRQAVAPKAHIPGVTRRWEPVQRLPPRATLNTPGASSPWRTPRPTGRFRTDPLPPRAEIVLSGRVLPDPPAAPAVRARLDAARDGGAPLLASPNWRGGRPLAARPFADRRGRLLPPGSAQTAALVDPSVVGPLAAFQDHWRSHRDHGYSWFRWHGVDVAHHYDRRGFHWWGFYQNGSYFWTRRYAGRFWWFDPYWRRWCFLHGGWWWWPAPAGGVYLNDGTGYENCVFADGGVLMTPDPTPPVTAPPDDATPAADSAPDLSPPAVDTTTVDGGDAPENIPPPPSDAPPLPTETPAR